MSQATRDVKSIFGRALEIAEAADRAAFLDEACAGDAALRADVAGLLGALEQAGGFLKRPENGTGAYTPPSEGPGTRIGPYKLLQQLGEGGMGAVFLAEQTEPVRRKVAVKIIKPGMDSSAVLARFSAERQALALMDHPNIAKVLDAGTTDAGRPYFVMELVKGIPLTKFCDENHLTPKERLELFIPVCQAVQHAHQKGIIHRDLKPSNVLIALYDGKPVPKVIDFGVAKALHQNLTERTMFTEVGSVIGTLEYMSPEQAELNNLDIDTRSDIYSLGVILYELLTGSRPLDAKRLRSAAFADMLRIIREEEPPKPSTKLSNSGDQLASISAQRKTEPRKLSKLVKGDLDWIVMKALEKDRARRYETANGFALDVQRYLADEPVQAGPPGATYRMRKFVRRHRGRVAAAAVVFFALVVGVVGASWGWVETRRQRDEAVMQRLVAAQERDRAEAAQQQAKDEAERAQAERERAEASRALADRNFQQARSAVDNYLQKVADNPDLKNNPNSHDLRKQLLAAALPFFEEFVKDKSTDPTVRFDQAKAYFRLAQVRLELGDNEAANQDYMRARDLATKLATDHPAVSEYRHFLAKTLNRLGDLYQAGVGKLAEAEAVFRQALAIQEKLAADVPADPEYRDELAFNHAGLGNLLRNLGKRTEAEAEFRRALAIAKLVVADFPTVHQYRSHLAYIHIFLGWQLHELGNWAESEASHRHALAIWERLVAEFPAVTHYRYDKAFSQNALGELLNEAGKWADAEVAFRQSLAAHEKLAAESPAVPNFRFNIADTQTNLGILLANLGKRVEAEAAYRSALAIDEKLAADFPSEYMYPANVAWIYVNFGSLLHDGGNSAAALDWYAKAIPLLEVHGAQHVYDSMIRRYLCFAHWGRSKALTRLGRLSEAVQECDQALALDYGATRSEIRLSRAMAQVLLTGDHSRAVAEAEAVTHGDQISGSILYNAARVYALAAAAAKDSDAPKESYAEKAVALLRRAQAVDYFKGGSHVEHMKTDSDLAALRGREDFQALLKELEAKK